MLTAAAVSGQEVTGGALTVGHVARGSRSWRRTREYLPGSCGGPRRTGGSGWLDPSAVHENDHLYVYIGLAILWLRMCEKDQNNASTYIIMNVVTAWWRQQLYEYIASLEKHPLQFKQHFRLATIKTYTSSRSLFDRVHTPWQTLGKQFCLLKVLLEAFYTLNNYRPISNLSVISKITEHIVKSLLNEHLSSNSLYNLNQSAYTIRHSTETTLLSLHDHVITAISHNKSPASDFSTFMLRLTP